MRMGRYAGEAVIILEVKRNPNGCWVYRSIFYDNSVCLFACHFGFACKVNCVIMSLSLSAACPLEFCFVFHRKFAVSNF